MKKFIFYVVLITTAGCEAPLSSGPAFWFPVWTYPYTYDPMMNAIAADKKTDEVFFLFKELGINPAPKIKRYSREGIRTVFVLDLKGAAGAEMKDIVIGNGAGWAVGARGSDTGEGPKYPFIIKYDGVNWKEILFSGNSTGYVFHAVAPIGADSCWLLVSDTWFPRDPMELWKYERGKITKLTAIKAYALTYDASTATTFAVTFKDGVQILISNDGGATWVEEKLKVKTSWRDFAPDYVRICAGAGALYIAATDTDIALPAGAIFRRTGPPGQGIYELLFYSPGNPHFAELEGITTDDEGRVLAVGKWTSVLYEDGRWVEEALPAKNHLYDAAAAATGFYAVGTDENFNVQILYHP